MVILDRIIKFLENKDDSSFPGVRDVAKNPTTDQIEKNREIFRKRMLVLAGFFGLIHILFPSIKDIDIGIKLIILATFSFFAITYFLPFQFWRKLIIIYNLANRVYL